MVYGRPRPMKTTRTSGKIALLSNFLATAFALAACGEAPLVPPPPPPSPPSSPAAAPTVAEARADAAAPTLARPLTNDEGMWLLNDFPSDRLGKLHGFAPTDEWLEHVRLS